MKLPPAGPQQQCPEDRSAVEGTEKDMVTAEVTACVAQSPSCVSTGIETMFITVSKGKIQNKK